MFPSDPSRRRRSHRSTFNLRILRNPEQAAEAVERRSCPTCESPAAARAGRGQARSPRSTTPPGSSSCLRCARSWPSRCRPTGNPGRADPIGYARCSTAQQDLQTQLDARHAAGCERIFFEKISSRIKVRPGYDRAITLAQEVKRAAPEQPIILTVRRWPSARSDRGTPRRSNRHTPISPPCTPAPDRATASPRLRPKTLSTALKLRGRLSGRYPN